MHPLRLVLPPLAMLAPLLGAEPGEVEGQVGDRWQLGPPDFEMGGVDADGDYALSELGGVTVLDNGNVLVADRNAPFLKVFSPSGVFLHDLGRRGQGPGEYEYVYEIDWCAPGELSVFDTDRRVHRYAGDMDFVATDLVSVEVIGGGVPYNRDCNADGLQVVTGWGDVETQFKPGLFEATAPVVLLRGQEVVRDFGLRLSSQRIGTIGPDGEPTGSGPHPFGRATVVALGSERVYIGDGASHEIEVYDAAGRPLPSIRWDGPDLDYDEAVEQLERRSVSEAPERSRARLRRMYQRLPELDQVPAYDRIVVSDVDEVWVREFVHPDADGESWVVFDAAGALIGRVGLPPRSTLWGVRDARVIYSSLDEFDVPVVRISRIER